MKDFKGNEVEPYWYDHPKGEWHSYCINISSTCDIHECLGKIKPRKTDNRFDWWCKNSQFYKNQWCNHAQGVANSVEDAKMAIEKGWVTVA